jgi:hypothetical protein
MFKYLSFIIIVLLCACAKTPVKKSPSPIYSTEIEDSFINIEKKRALDTYRLLRLRDLERRQKRKTSKSRRPRKSVIKNFVKIKPKPVEIKIPTYPKRDPEEIMMEVNQNLSYYCMKKRKSKKFKEPTECEVFAQEKLKECRIKYVQEDNAKLVRCIKGRLNL